MRQTVRANPAECTGCGACVSVCPKGAVSMKPDREGFLYPAVDAALCVGCDLCEKRCPAGKAQQAACKPAAFGVRDVRDDVRAASSSGGVFTALAESVLSRGGAVFGAVFGDDFKVEHVGAVSRDGIRPMRGSKYVQSDAASALADVQDLLSRDIPVLFTGTPCQVAGLYALLGKGRPGGLLTADFICHGVPSPGVFAAYLDALQKQQGSSLVDYSFRDKRLGWKDFSAAARFADGTEHTGTQTTEPFLRGFLKNLYLRPSCHACTDLRYGGHAADLTIADLWGAKDVFPDWDDDKGLSLVFANTPAGQRALDACASLERRAIGDVSVLRRANPSIFQPAAANPHRAKFWNAFHKHGFSEELVERCLRETRTEAAVKRIRRIPAALIRRTRSLLGR
ncbi:MAG: Coenzyme F420 hydrogenase/dehydrogenase, beta subunit C-terminal domain [Clostridia bacterium]|nr:Coenzyme F420 hydrogenase/dehydrogenase, beta subunit C-terminal domain [Clostridia bacterium]